MEAVGLYHIVEVFHTSERTSTTAMLCRTGVNTQGMFCTFVFYSRLSSADDVIPFGIVYPQSILWHNQRDQDQHVPLHLSDVEKFLRGWSRPSRAHDPFVLRTLSRVAEAMKMFLRRMAIVLIREAASRPVLLQYTGDGTPLKYRHFATTAGPGAAIKRSGIHSEEFYVHNQIVSYITASGERKQRIILSDLVPMTGGKKGAALLALFDDFLVDARSAGHQDIVILWLCFDRAPFEHLTQLIKAWIVRQAAQRRDSALPAELEFLLTWPLCRPCCLHDAHNALLWSIRGRFDTSIVMEEVYIAVSSCRHSFKQILDACPQWIVDMLVPCPIERLEQPSVLREAWTALGVPPDMLEDLIELRLCFRDGQLLFCQDANLQDLVARVTSLMLYMWAFPNFQESRWITAGLSFRCITRSLLTGLDSVVQRVIKDPSQSNWYINGWTKLSSEGRSCIVVTGLSAYPCEAVMRAMMEDPRLFRHKDEWLRLAQEEVEYLDQLSLGTWAFIAQACDYNSQQLRTEVLRAAHTSISFLQFRVFAILDDLPYSLMFGDIQDNLLKLRHGVEPDEPVSGRIWRLLEIGYPKHSIEQALLLAREALFSTKMAEMQHSSTKWIKRFHEDIGREGLQIRAFTHTLRHLLPEPDELQKEIDKLIGRLDRLEGKRPGRVGGSHMFCKDLVELSSRWKARGRQVRAKPQRHIFKHHVKGWRDTCDNSKSTYRRRAVAHAGQKGHDIMMAIEEVQTCIAVKNNSRDSIESQMSRCPSRRAN
jgi:hypothetical protein